MKQATAMHPQLLQQRQKDMLQLRSLSVTASCCGIAYNLLQPTPLWAPAAWGAFFISCHLPLICTSGNLLQIFDRSKNLQGCWMASCPNLPGYAQLDQCCTQGTTSPNYFVTVWVSHWIQIMRLLHRNRNI